jgi:hypothetical protein
MMPLALVEVVTAVMTVIGIGIAVTVTALVLVLAALGAMTRTRRGIGTLAVGAEPALALVTGATANTMKNGMNRGPAKTVTMLTNVKTATAEASPTNPMV